MVDKSLLRTNYKELIQKINTLENDLKVLDDTELKAKTTYLTNFLKKEKNFEPIIAESFALVRESSRRCLGLRHYDVQLLGGLVLNDGKIAEMKTGEGKTIVATLPAYLNSLNKKSVQIITVNDYLVKRDYNSVREIYQTLGINVGYIQENFSESKRQKNYKSDITYVTNSELGFDYLRDNLAYNKKNLRLPEFNYCIIDEIDSVLIDEAQTPLIMSRSIKTSIQKYLIAKQVIKYLRINKDFQVDEKKGIVILREEGISIIKQLLKTNDLYDLENPWIPYILNALKAQTLFLINVHYIIEKNQIAIVDEFTGRISQDRKWGDGLHQAIQAKENLKIDEDTEVIASITYQNLFLLYPKLSGMTGTAKTSEVEFDRIFELGVSVIPTAKPNRRIDLPDLLYQDEFTKWRAVINESKKITSRKQPILIGTKTIEQSEMLSYLLKQYKLYHEILNARPKNLKNEARIVASAGEVGRITIATNMAGRGTDIILGGNLEYKIPNKLLNILSLAMTKKLKKNIYFLIHDKILKNVSQKFLSCIFTVISLDNFDKLFVDISLEKTLFYTDLIRIFESYIIFLLNNLELSEKKVYNLRNQFIKNNGGLFVIGTERNDSRRIDNQLRGRCGRQGDPGTSRFFLSYNDKLLRLFGGEKVKQVESFNNQPIESPIITSALDSAQNQLEETSFGFRKNLVEYDEAVNSQRNTIYLDRKELLNYNDVKDEIILTHGEQILAEFLDYLKSKKIEFNIIELINQFQYFFGNALLHELNEDLNQENIDKYLKAKLIDRSKKVIENKYLKMLFSPNYENEYINYVTLYFFEELWLLCQSKKLDREVMFNQIFNVIDRNVFIVCLDILWQEHLHLLNLYRDTISWRSYGQRNPLFEYKRDIYLTYIDQLQVFRHILTHKTIRSNPY